VVSGQVTPDWDCPQSNQILSSFKTDNLICSIQTLDNIYLARHRGILRSLCTSRDTGLGEESGEHGILPWNGYGSRGITFSNRNDTKDINSIRVDMGSRTNHLMSLENI
jgi:hypothetical protein